jgi:VanZ family protein
MRTLLAWGPALGWAAVLFALSELRSLPGPLTPLAGINDKVAHLVLYTLLGAALAWGRLRSPNPPRHALLLALGIVYGALDEWHQAFVPGRTPSVLDWVADTVGVIVGYTLVLAFAHRTAGPSASPSNPRTE